MGQEFKVCQAAYILLFYSGLMMGFKNIFCVGDDGNIATNYSTLIDMKNTNKIKFSVTTSRVEETQDSNYTSTDGDNQMETTKTITKEARTEPSSPKLVSFVSSISALTSSNTTRPTIEVRTESASPKLVSFVSSTSALLASTTTIATNVTASKSSDITVPLIIGLLILLLIIISVICLAFILKKKKRMKYSLDFKSRPSEEAGIPLHNVKG